MYSKAQVKKTILSRPGSVCVVIFLLIDLEQFRQYSIFQISYTNVKYFECVTYMYFSVALMPTSCALGYRYQ